MAVITLPTRRDSLKVFLGASAAAAFGQSTGLTATKLAGDFTLISGAGANVLLYAAPDGNLLVDGGVPGKSADLLRFIAEQTANKPVRTLINTHWHYESTGSNEALGKAGARIIAHENTRLWLGAEIDTHWSGKVYTPLPKIARPTETFYTTKKFDFGGQSVEAGYMLQAHTDSDIYVHFPQAGILMVGDVVSPGRYPDLDWSTGGWISGMVDGQRLLLTVAKDDTRIIAATGAPITKADLQAHLNKLVALRDGMLKMFREGKSPDQMQADGLTKEYDAQWGDPKQFLHNAYRGMWGHVREVGGIV